MGDEEEDEERTHVSLKDRLKTMVSICLLLIINVLAKSHRKRKTCFNKERISRTHQYYK